MVGTGCAQLGLGAGHAFAHFFGGGGGQLAAANGLAPDHVVAGDEMAAGGRPGPFMALANVLALGIGDVRACVKVDDTVPGIEEGRNAGMPTT